MVLFHLSDVSARIMLYIFILSVLENLGALFNSNMVALNKQLLSNAIFLVRSGLWVLPAIALGFINPVYRSYDVVLIAWSTGAIISILITIWCWRDLPWRVVAAVPVDWQWIKQGVSKSSLYWIGMIGLIGGSFADRFVINHFLDLKFVGLLTFYASFTNAMLTLMQSGVIVFSYPRLIALFRDGDLKGFRKEVWHTVWQMATGATGIALLLGVAVPFVGRLLGRPSLVENAWTFWLLLFGCWIRVNTEVFFYVLFARHQDKPLWLGNLLFLIPALGGSIILVPQIGFSGIGYSSILSCTFLLLWRLWYSRDLLLTKPDAG
jgi:O-antigen/teichoic acid export membrane protein